MKIYIDVTYLMRINFLSGIQRVVREVVIRLLKGRDGFEIVPFKWMESEEALTLINPNDFLECFGTGFLIKQKIRSCGKIYLHEISAGDIFFDLDGVWNPGNHTRSHVYRELKKYGVKIVVYIYDIIPVKYPQFANGFTLLRFLTRYLAPVLKYSDLVMTSTKSVFDQVNELCAELGIPQKKGGVTWLGSDFDSAQSAGEVSEKAREIVESGKKYILSVGTIEPRKNHSLLLDAYDQRLSELGVSMVFAGKVGWNVKDLIERIKTHPDYDSGIYLLEGESDATIKYLYQNSFCVVCPSFDEGFGLPMVEALMNGCLLLASDTPVFREVGKDIADYFDPHSPTSFIDIVEKYLNDHAFYDKRKSATSKYSPAKWDDIVNSFVSIFKKIENVNTIEIPQIQQMVILSARMDDLMGTLPFIEKFMDFIKEIVVICPDQMACDLKREYSGRLKIETISDSEALQGTPLPDDHSTRNFYLRSLAIRSSKIDDVFIMSDDDYRPLHDVPIKDFIEDGKYIAYYCYDLDKWKGAEWNVRETSFDICKRKSYEFLKSHGYPYRMYAAHMPQVIDKRIWRELHEKYPEIETMGLCEWDTYFNYANHAYPSMFKNDIYVAMCWPGKLTSWDCQYIPHNYIFENFYLDNYEFGRIFSKFSPNFAGDAQLAENRQKAQIFMRDQLKFDGFRKRFKKLENAYQLRYREQPNFGIFSTEDGESIKILLPKRLLLERGSFIRIPCIVKLSGKYLSESFIVKQIFIDLSGNELCPACRELNIPQGFDKFDLPINTPKSLPVFCQYSLSIEIDGIVFEKHIPLRTVTSLDGVRPSDFQFNPSRRKIERICDLGRSAMTRSYALAKKIYHKFR